MALVIDDNLLKQANLNEQQMLIEITFMLYEKNIIRLGKAREFGGLSLMDFQQEMTKRKISYYTEEKLLQEFSHMKEQGEI